MAEENRRPSYVADHSVTEKIADSVRAVSFDGANMRVELTVTRMEHDESGTRKTTQHPAVRLVLPLNTVNELLQKVNGALADLEKQGVLKRAGPGQTPGGGSPSPYTQ